MHQDKRPEFLLKMYEQLWKSIDRVEGDLWRFFGFYITIIATHAVVARGDIDIRVGIVLLILVPCWGMCVVASSWKWFNRNRMMVIFIESQFVSVQVRSWQWAATMDAVD